MFIVGLGNVYGQHTRVHTYPTRGFWTTESSPAARDTTFVRFYNEKHILVYEEAVPKLLNIKRRSVKKRLTATLAKLLNEQKEIEALRQKKQLIAVVLGK